MFPENELVLVIGANNSGAPAAPKAERTELRKYGNPSSRGSFKFNNYTLFTGNNLVLDGIQ